MEKAFVWGVIASSKWLGEGMFNDGVFGQWPPLAPATLVPTHPVGDIVDVPPALRVGATPGSSSKPMVS